MKKCAVGGIPSSHKGKQNKEFFSLFQRKKTSIIQGNELEGAVSQLPGVQVIRKGQVHFFSFSKAITVLSSMLDDLVTSDTPV